MSKKPATPQKLPQRQKADGSHIDSVLAEISSGFGGYFERVQQSRLQGDPELYRWFLSLTNDDLPELPFEIKPAVMVHGWEVLRQEVTEAMQYGHPREHCGALTADLLAVKAAVESFEF